MYISFHVSPQALAYPDILGEVFCYVRVERLARLEQAGYDQVALPVVNRVSASGTQ